MPATLIAKGSQKMLSGAASRSPCASVSYTLGVMQSPLFRVSGVVPGGGLIETSTSTANDALRIADRWALAGVSSTDGSGRAFEHEEFKTFHTNRT